MRFISYNTDEAMICEEINLPMNVTQGLAGFTMIY